MPLLPGAEPYHHSGGPVGVLLCHGFSGTPQSLRPWGEHLAATGLSVSLPRLPGHGTSWQDMRLTRWEDWYAEVNRAFTELRDACHHVFVMGLSMGACLGLRLAERHGDAIAGLVLVNPSLMGLDWRLRFLPVLKHVVPTTKPIVGDIKKPSTYEVSYERLPLKPLYSLTQLWRLTRADLSRVTQPLLVYRSAEDHVVEPESTALLQARVASAECEVRVLPDSYHVATLDNDAEQIFAGSLEFVRRHAHAAQPGS